MDSGEEDMDGHFLMSEYLIHMPHLTVNRAYLMQTYSVWHECAKIRAYEECGREIEHCSFTRIPGHVTFWRIGERRQTMPQTSSLNAQYLLGWVVHSPSPFFDLSIENYVLTSALRFTTQGSRQTIVLSF